MGNPKFRLSDMMPNAWFYKLKDMGKPKNHNNTFPKKKKQEPTFCSTKPVPHQQYHHHPRKSYYFTKPDGDRLCNYTPPIPKDPPSKQRIKRRRSRSTNSSSKLVSSSVSTGCRCRASLESVWTKSDSPLEHYSYSSCSPDPLLHEEPEFRCDRALTTVTFDDMISKSTTCDYPDDIVINVDKASLLRKPNFSDGLDSLFEFELPSIILKPPKFNDGLNNLNKKETKGTARYKRSLVGSYSEDRLNSVIVREQRTSPVRGIRLRNNSPRIGSRKVQIHGRKSASSSSKRNNLSDSFAIVKASFDPHMDFRESMVEMIVENNIRESKDFEDLLACYLTLNSDEYHDLIIKVFKQIWFDLTHCNPSKK